MKLEERKGKTFLHAQQSSNVDLGDMAYTGRERGFDTPL
jgi:hypothetical protein